MDQKLTIVKKAYRIDLSKIQDGFMYRYSEVMCHAEKLTKAKKELLKIASIEGLLLRGKQELTYLNIPVIRHKIEDIVVFIGSEMTRYAAQSQIKQHKKDQKLFEILDDESITHCYIKKGPYYCPNYCGYTDHLHEAGVYTKEAAIDHVRFVNGCYAIPIDVDKHNNMIKEKIADLSTRIIQ